MSVLGSTWAYKIQRDEHGSAVRYKARFCVQGFSQIRGVDYFETLASVTRHESIRTVFALSAALDLGLHNMDDKNAYCQSECMSSRPRGGYYHIDTPITSLLIPARTRKVEQSQAKVGFHS